MYQLVNYFELLVTVVRGSIVSSVRLIRKVSQFRVQSYYVVASAHTYLCVCVCIMAGDDNSHNTFMWSLVHPKFLHTPIHGAL